MLSEKRYDKKYVSRCRDQIRQLLALYKKLKAPTAFDQAFLTHAILALDHYFVHRMRGAEGKDGNPLNEVRMLCNSIKYHNGIMANDKTISYDPGKSVLGAKLGAPITLSADGVARLAEAFFSEIEARYQ